MAAARRGVRPATEVRESESRLETDVVLCERERAEGELGEDVPCKRRVIGVAEGPGEASRPRSVDEEGRC